MSDKPPGKYYGNPEKQTNPKAITMNPKGKPKGPGKNVLKVPPTLPPPRHLHDASHVKISEVDPTSSAIFSASTSVREVDGRVSFTPSAPASVDIARDTYTQLLTDNSNLSKVLLPEYLDYYTTAMIWFRILSLKVKNQRTLTQVEAQVINLIEYQPFCVPEPICLQLRALGNAVSHTGQHLYPQFPELPMHVIGAFGGYFGPMNHEYHNLYEELPCLGVTAEAIRHSVSNAPAGPYVSALVFPDHPCNGNLIGFRPLGHRRPEAKDFSANYGITDAQFACNPPESMINIGFLLAISDQLANSKTFKNTHVVFSTLSELGGQALTTVQLPLVAPGVLCSRGEIRTSSLSKVSNSVFGSGTFFLPQLMKEPSVNDHNVWCCVTSNQDHPLPENWINNRNVRRDLPAQYHVNVFTSVSLNAIIHRSSIIRAMVLTSR